MFMKEVVNMEQHASLGIPMYFINIAILGYQRENLALLHTNIKGTDQTVHSDQRLWCLLSGKQNSPTNAIHNLNNLASFCRRAGWFGHYLVRNS